MTEAPAAAPMGGGSKRLGNPRGVGKVIVLYIVTLGIYGFIWVWKSFAEVKRYRGQGVGGWGLFLIIANVFLLPSYVGKMYQEDGKQAPITGMAGFWCLVPYIGAFIWMAKVQGALNSFWTSKGATV